MRKFRKNNIESQSIRYGDIVYLKMQDVHKTKFLVCKSSLKEAPKAIPKEEMMKDINLYKCLFTIIPSTTNYAKNLTDRTLKMYSRSKSTVDYSTLKSLESNIEVEYRINLENYEKYVGIEIGYQQSFQLLHNTTGMFLGYDKGSNRNESGQEYKMHLFQVPGEHTTFKIHPCKKYQKDSEGIVYYREPVYITEVTKMSYFMYTQDEDTREEEIFDPKYTGMVGQRFIDEKNTLLYNRKREPSSNIRSKVQKLEDTNTDITLFSEQEKEWIFEFYGRREDPNLVYSGDLIWLHHLELDLSLVCSRFKKKIQSIGLSRTYYAQFSKTDEFESNYIKYGGSSQGLWIIETIEPLVMSPIQQEAIIRLKHVESSLYLSIDEERLVMREIADNSCNFFMKVLDSESLEGEYIRTTSIVKIYSMLNSYQIRAMIMQGNQKGKGKNLTQQKKPLTALNLDDVNQNYQPLLDSQDLNFDSFQIIVPNKISNRETLYLKNIVPLIRNYMSFLELEQTTPDDIPAKIKKDKIDYFESVIKSLDDFCQNRIYFSSPENRFGSTNSFRQKYMRELYIIDLFVEILKLQLPEYKAEKIFSSNFSTISRSSKAKFKRALDKNKKKAGCRSLLENIMLEINPNSLKVKIANKIFKMLTMICKNNSRNQFYFYKRAPEILYFGKYLINATECFNSILKGNEILMSELSSEIRINLISLQCLPNSHQFSIREYGKLKEDLFRKKNTYSGENKDYKNLESLSSGDESDFSHQKKDFMGRNAVYYYYKELIENDDKGIDFYKPLLNFFTTICHSDQSSSHLNHDILYSIVIMDGKICSSFLLNIQLVDNDALIVDVPDIKSKLDLLHIFRNPLKFTKTVAYLEKQIALYCQLAKSGNSRWRKFLQSIFTLNYLNDEIFNPENPSKVIAYFIELKVFLYISSEPSFRISVLPDLCGVVEVPGDNDDEDNSIFERRLNTLNRKVEDLESFFNEALQYLEEVSDKMISNIMSSASDPKSKRKEMVQINLNNEQSLQVFLKIIQLIISSNKIHKVVANSEFSKLIYQLILILEFNPCFHQQTLYLQQYRSFKLKEFGIFSSNKLQRTNTMTRGHSLKRRSSSGSDQNNSNSNNKNKSAVLKELEKSSQDMDSKTEAAAMAEKEKEERKKSFWRKMKKFFFGDESLYKIHLKRIKDIKRIQSDTIINSFHHPKYLNNSLMSSYYILSSKIDYFKSGGLYDISQATTMSLWNEIRCNVINCLDIILSLRQDSLLKNLIEFFKIKVKECEKEEDLVFVPNSSKDPMSKLKEALTVKIENELDNLIPEIMLSSISQFDKKFRKHRKKKLSNIRKTYAKKGLTRKPTIFDLKKDQTYGHAHKIFNFDHYFTSQPVDIASFPSILVSFVYSEDFELDKKLVRLIRRLFSQRKEFFEHVGKLEFISKREDVQDYFKIKELIEKLTAEISSFHETMEQKTEIEKTINVIVKMTDKLTQFLRAEKDVLTFSNKNVLINNSRNSKKASKRASISPAKNRLRFNAFKQEQKEETKQYDFEPSIRNQNIHRYQCCHKTILSLIKTVSPYVLGYKSSEVPGLHQKLCSILKSSFMYLQKFVKFNPENQSILINNVRDILSTADVELGQIDLIVCIYEVNHSLIETKADFLIRIFIDLTKKFGRRAKFLKFLLVLINTSGTLGLSNRGKVMGIFNATDDIGMKTVKLLLFSKYQANRFYMQLEAQKINNMTKLSDELDKKIDEPFLWHGLLLKIFYMCSKDRQCQSKIRKLFSLQHFLELLGEKDIFEVHSQSKEEHSRDSSTNSLAGGQVDPMGSANKHNDFDTPQRERTTKFVEDMHEGDISLNDSIYDNRIANEGYSLLKVHISNILRKFYLKNFEVNMDIVKAFSHLMDTERMRIFQINEKDFFRKIKINLNFRGLNSDDIRDFGMVENGNLYVRYVDYLLLNIFPILIKYANTRFSDLSPGEIEEMYDGSYFIRFVDCFTRKLKKITDLLETNHWKVLSRFNSLIKALKLTEADITDKKLLENNGIEEINHSRTSKFGSAKKDTYQFETFLTIERTKTRPVLQRNTTMEQRKWFIVSDFFKESKKIESLESEERMMLANILMNMNQLFPTNEFPSIKISPKIIFAKIIRYVMKSFYIISEQENVIFILDTMKLILESASDKEELEIFQNILNNYEATTMIMSIMSDEKFKMNFELFSSLLNFGIKLLEGGNLMIQNKIHNYFISYPRSEMIFKRIYSLISNQMSTLRDDLYTAKENNEQDSIIMESCMRFLQLLAEGHNLNLQRYLKFQYESQRSYNMISLTIELLATYFECGSNRMFDSMMRTIDMLIEFVQGPCIENQITIVEGRFLELANKILNQSIDGELIINEEIRGSDDLSESSSSSNEDLKPWMVEQLKNKCLILLISLLESQTDGKMVAKIMQYIPVESLANNLIRTFMRYVYLYDMEYKEEAFNHVEERPDEIEEGETRKHPMYYQTIIESGFYLYFLLLEYKNVLKLDDFEIEWNEDYNTLNEDIKERIRESQMVSSKGSNRLVIPPRKSKILKVNINSEEHALYHELKDLKNSEKFRLACKFFSDNSASIELLRDGKLEKINFFLPVYSGSLQSDVKEQFQVSVDRSSSKSKVFDLQREAKYLIRRAKQEYKIKQSVNKYKVFNLIYEYPHLWSTLGFYSLLLCVVVILFSYHYEEDSENPISTPVFMGHFYNFDGSDTVKTFTRWFFIVIGVVITLSAMIREISDFTRIAPLYFTELKFHQLMDYGLVGSYYRLFRHHFGNFVTLFHDNPLLGYYFLYICCGVLGIFVHPFFYSILLTEVVLRFKLLQSIINAVWGPRIQLAYTFLLFWIIVYLFAIYAYETKEYQFETSHLTHLYHYLFRVYDITFKYDSGVGGYFQDTMRIPYRDVLYDSLFNLIVVMIMLDIVSGLIIDTFGALRLQYEERLRDMNNRCFICGINKEIFDRLSDTRARYNSHIKHDHNMWNYLWYMGYLGDKDETEYTGNETYISNNLKDKEVNWFPIGRALSLNQESKNKEEFSEQFMLEVEKNLDDSLLLMEESKRMIEFAVKVNVASANNYY